MAMKLAELDEGTGFPPAFANVVNIAATIEAAATALSADYAQRGVRLQWRPRKKSLKSKDGWYSHVMASSCDRFYELVAAITHKENRLQRTNPVEWEVFRLLSALTPAQPQLMELAHNDPDMAIRELVRQIELVRQQFVATADLLGRTEGAAERPEENGEAEWRRVSSELLARAGGGMTLTEAAKRLGLSRQGMHKRIASHSALGMIMDGKIVVPTIQFTGRNGNEEILPGIDDVVRQFNDANAGSWSALQFLIENDANLGHPPIAFLREGKTDAVQHAARAYLGTGEE